MARELRRWPEPVAGQPPPAQPRDWFSCSGRGADGNVGGRTQHGIVTIVRDGGVLRGTVRGVGEEAALPLRDVTMQGTELHYLLPLRDPTPARITFDGLAGTGTWGDPSGRGGSLRVVKRR